MLLLQIPASFIPDTEQVATLLVRIALTLLVAWLLQRAGFLVVRRLERWLVRATHASEPGIQRARTIGQMLRHLITTLVSVGALVHLLDVVGWDVKPLLVGASILGAALGFGAQFLVRDVIAGAFILIEDQFSVGDAIEINGQIATVEAVTLRSTRLRDYQGRLLFVPNGEMKIVVNRSRDWHLAAVDLPLAANQDLTHAFELAQQVADEVNANADLRSRLLEPLQVIGLERIGADGVQLRLAGRAHPGLAALTVQRETRRIAMLKLRESGLRASTGPEVSIFSTTGAPPQDPSAFGE